MLYAAMTDVGKVRPQNEDSNCAIKENAYYLFVVADGMGGHQAGEVASSMAVNGVVQLCGKYGASMPDGQLLMRRAVSEVNREIFVKSKQDKNDTGMGTTFTGAIIRNGKMSIAHVGDSRLYMVRDNQLFMLTQDHSYVAELVRFGQITEQEALHHPQRNVITRAIGVESIVRVDTDEIGIKDGDMFMFCSDGLTNFVSDDRISQILSAKGSPQAKAELLIDEALEGGGLDNITAIVVQIEEGDLI